MITGASHSLGSVTRKEKRIAFVRNEFPLSIGSDPRHDHCAIQGYGIDPIVSTYHS